MTADALLDALAREDLADAVVLWHSPRPNANGRYWRIWSHGHVEVLPRGWRPERGPNYPPGSEWPTDTPKNRANAERRRDG